MAAVLLVLEVLEVAVMAVQMLMDLTLQPIPEVAEAGPVQASVSL